MHYPWSTTRSTLLGLALALVAIGGFIPSASAQLSEDTVFSSPLPIFPITPVQGGGGENAGPQPPDGLPPGVSPIPPPVRFANRLDMPISDKDLEVVNAQAIIQEGKGK